MASKDWSSGLLDCCKDPGSCAYGFFCCPCLACSVAGDFDENRLLPLFDICGPSALSACGIPLFVPPAALALRVGIRQKYGIEGSMCSDILKSCICMWCVWCQMHRELKYRKDHPTTMQPKSL